MNQGRSLIGHISSSSSDKSTKCCPNYRSCLLKAAFQRLRTVSTLVETGHLGVTSLQESLDLLPELLDGGPLVPGKLSGLLLSSSSQIRREPFKQSLGCSRDPQEAGRPLPPLPASHLIFVSIQRPSPWQTGWCGERVHQSSCVLEEEPKTFFARISSLTPLFKNIEYSIFFKR